MFTKTARYYDTLYAFKDYKGASEAVHALIQQHAPAAKNILDVGCGTGSHLRFLSEYYETEGLDISADLIAVAREKAPDVPFHISDMVDFRIERRFDVVTCLFSAIAYVETLERMCQAVSNMAEHLNPGGLLIIEPWFDQQTYWTDTVTVNQSCDGDDLKIAWMYTSKKENAVSILDIHYLVGTPPGVDYFTEQHRMGLFSKDQYMHALEEAGITRAVYDPHGLFQRGLYIAFK
jgi:trans-aconitate methyltransferase